MASTSLKLLTNILFGTKWRVHYYHSCTLELSPCHWRLTFAFGQLQKLTFFHICLGAGHPGFHGQEPLHPL